MNIINQKCYFRTSAKDGFNKALLQITNKCNMKCKHCFVSSDLTGIDLTLNNFHNYVIPFLLATNTTKVTLTGGEPLLNKDMFSIISSLLSNNIEIAICTNGLNVDEHFMNKLQEIASPNDVHFNVSLDSFNEIGYSEFRGICNVYMLVKKNIELIASRGYLKGILCTPNSFSDIYQYVKIAEFAKQIGGKYVLFNPIAKLGRGDENHNVVKVADSILDEIAIKTSYLISDDFDVTYVRFPSKVNTFNSKCFVNKLIYIYANGDVVRCPYVSFLSNTSRDYDKINKSQNIVGNVLTGDLISLSNSINNNKISEFECEEMG